MAINLNTQYSTKNVPISTNYPYGQGMNVSAQGAGDAVPWEAAVFNDWNGYFQALLSAAGIVPSGTPDNAVTSQYLAALNALISRVNPVGSLLFWAGNNPPLGYWHLNGDTQAGARLTHTVIASFAAANMGYIRVSGDDLILTDSQFFFRGKGSSTRAVGQFKDQSHPQIETVRRVVVNGTPSDGVEVVTLPRSGAVSAPLAVGASTGSTRYGLTFQKFFPDNAVPKSNTVMVCIYHGVFS